VLELKRRKRIKVKQTRKRVEAEMKPQPTPGPQLQEDVKKAILQNLELIKENMVLLSQSSKAVHEGLAMHSKVLSSTYDLLVRCFRHESSAPPDSMKYVA